MAVIIMMTCSVLGNNNLPNLNHIVKEHHPPLPGYDHVYSMVKLLNVNFKSREKFYS